MSKSYATTLDSLPDNLRDPQLSLNTFERQLKTYIFYEILTTKRAKEIRDFLEYVLYKFTLYLLTYLLTRTYRVEHVFVQRWYRQEWLSALLLLSWEKQPTDADAADHLGYCCLQPVLAGRWDRWQQRRSHTSLDHGHQQTLSACEHKQTNSTRWRVTSDFRSNIVEGSLA